MMNEDVWIAVKLDDDSMWRTSCRLQAGVEVLGFADEAMIEAQLALLGEYKWTPVSDTLKPVFFYGMNGAMCAFWEPDHPLWTPCPAAQSGR